MLTCNVCLCQFRQRCGLTKHFLTQHSSQIREQDRTTSIYNQDVYMDPDNDSDNESNVDRTSAQPYQGAALPIHGGQHVASHELPEWKPLAPFSSLAQWQLCRTMVEEN